MSELKSKFSYKQVDSFRNGVGSTINIFERKEETPEGGKIFKLFARKVGTEELISVGSIATAPLTAAEL